MLELCISIENKWNANKMIQCEAEIFTRFTEISSEKKYIFTIPENIWFIWLNVSKYFTHSFNCVLHTFGVVATFVVTLGDFIDGWDESKERKKKVSIDLHFNGIVSHKRDKELFKRFLPDGYGIFGLLWQIYGREIYLHDWTFAGEAKHLWL